MTSSRTSSPPVTAGQHGKTTSSHDPFADTAIERRGGGAAPARADRQTDAPLPHEQDESSHSQKSASASHDKVGNQAFDDLAKGKQDTDKGPEMDKVYNEQLAPDRGSRDPRQ